MLEFFFNGECSQKVYYVSPYNSKQFAFLKFIFLYIVHFSGSCGGCTSKAILRPVIEQ